jgi:hypothetical protein
MFHGETWFQSREDSRIVGRVSEARTVDILESEKQKKTVWKMVPVLLSKVPGSSDESSQAIKPFNRDELCGRFPGSWEHYEALKAAQAEVPITAHPYVPSGATTSGTPLHAADFIPRASLAWLSALGFSTIEQIAEMTDVVAQGLRGGSKLRKQAQEFLKRT